MELFCLAAPGNWLYSEEELKYAIFSDIHSNLEGLQAVIRKAEERKVDKYVCCGDIIGYNANPEECVSLVRDTADFIIKGNHERALIDLMNNDIPNMNMTALEALKKNMRMLSDDSVNWLTSLPDSTDVSDMFLVFHGSPRNPDEYVFLLEDARSGFLFIKSKFETPLNQLCFIGHTHVCNFFQYNSLSDETSEQIISRDCKFNLISERYYMVNVGSCGQYRGGIAAASFVILDTGKSELEFHFAEYDLEKTQRRIIECGIPEMLARRLSMGK